MLLMKFNHRGFNDCTREPVAVKGVKLCLQIAEKYIYTTESLQSPNQGLVTSSLSPLIPDGSPPETKNKNSDIRKTQGQKKEKKLPTNREHVQMHGEEVSEECRDDDGEKDKKRAFSNPIPPWPSSTPDVSHLPPPFRLPSS